MRPRLPEPWAVLGILALILSLVCAFLVLAGCSVSDDNGRVEAGSNAWVREIHPTLADGRTVTCLTYNRHGISCEWGYAQ